MKQLYLRRVVVALEKKNKILILNDDMPWGHRAIAKAIYGYLKTNESDYNYTVDFVEVKTETSFSNFLYTVAYRYAPKATKVFHKYSGSKLANSILKDISKKNMVNLEALLEKEKPDLVISTYFINSHSLVELRKRKNLNYKLWSVVHDPWTIAPPTLIKDADLNIVYDDISYKEGLKWGIEQDKMFITGWWTRHEMYAEYDRESVRRKLGFYDNRPVIFMGGGSLGTSALPKLMASIFSLKTKAGFIINTGTDKSAYRMVKMAVRIIKMLHKEELIIVKHFGWIDNMAEVLSACDIVFGKAGPNFLFDVIAAKKPFVAITHIGGQEDGNIDLIETKKIGWIKEKKRDFQRFLHDFLENPVLFEGMYTQNIEAERSTNQKSLPLLLHKIISEFE